MRRKSENIGINKWLIPLFFIVIIGTFGSIRFYSAFQQRKWIGNTPFVVFDSTSLRISVYEPSVERIYTYLLPKTGYIEVPLGYGSYKLEDVRELSEVEGKGEILLSSAVSNTFGIPFDSTVNTLNDWDRLMVWYAEIMYEDKDTVVDLADEPIFSVEERMDGEELEKVDYAKVDHFFKHDLWEREITDENLSVGIFNASGESNIALTVSRKLERIGVHVTEIDNLSDKVGGSCEMRVKEDEKYSYTVKRLKTLFGCNLSGAAPHPRFDIMLITATSI